MTAPLVSVIVCHHLPENRKYLDACLRSLEAQVGVDIEVLLMTDNYVPQDLPNYVQHHIVPDGSRWVGKVNLGVPKTDPRSKYLMILNDDVILSKYAIATMSRKTGDGGVIMNPMSNCDNGWLYHTPIELVTDAGPYFPLDKRFYESLEELHGLEWLIVAKPPGPNVVIPVPYVCFYATLIPRSVWNSVGPLDLQCRLSHDDEDYCYRARNIGIQSMVDLESFIFHFGGRTSSKTDTDPERAETHAYFNKKWGRA